MVNTGAARDRPVAMATQEIHFASMAQLVESSPMLLVIKWKSNRLRLMTVSQACFTRLVWMTNFHHHQQGRGCNWLNLIKIMVPAMIRLAPPHPQLNPSLHLHYHRDIFSPITLDLNAVITELDLKTCFFCLS
jgi:hypothetical protein